MGRPCVLSPIVPHVAAFSHWKGAGDDGVQNFVTHAVSIGVLLLVNMPDMSRLHSRFLSQCLEQCPRSLIELHKGTGQDSGIKSAKCSTGGSRQQDQERDMQHGGAKTAGSSA